MKKTKIVATVGPACQEERKLRTLLKAADVLRINASHTVPSELRRWILFIRRVAVSLDKSVGIVVDLQGPRVRTGLLQGKIPLSLKRGEDVSIVVSTRPGCGTTITTPCSQFPQMVKVGDDVLLENGSMKMEVRGVKKSRVTCRVMIGGLLGENKGINLPNAPVDLPTLTRKDQVDLAVAAALQVDYVALSFVRSERDVLILKRRLQRHQREIPIIAKIEKPSAVKNIDAILEHTNGIMVARGDLGIEMGVEKVPFVQKILIEKAHERNIFVITATQMLESMIESPHPTRAEVSDVANAVFDGTDAVMLSEETAIGTYPIEAVRMMSEIILEAERHIKPSFVNQGSTMGRVDAVSPLGAITYAALNAASNLGAQAIVVFSLSGKTALYISTLRPNCPILALTSSERIASRLTLLRGVIPLVVRHSRSTDEMVRTADAVILKRGLLQKGAPVVVVSGRQALPGARYMTKIHRIGERQWET